MKLVIVLETLELVNVPEITPDAQEVAGAMLLATMLWKAMLSPVIVARAMLPVPAPPASPVIVCNAILLSRMVLAAICAVVIVALAMLAAVMPLAKSGDAVMTPDASIVRKAGDAGNAGRLIV